MTMFWLKNRTAVAPGSIRVYVTREAVERANDVLIGRRENNPIDNYVDVYSRYNIERPTSQEISEAATTAMRMARMGKVA